MRRNASRLFQSLVPAVLWASASFAAGEPKFIPFHKPNLIPIDMSADGTKVVGSSYFGSPIFSWSKDGGIAQLGGGCTAGQVSISGDGSTIVGCVVDATGVQQAATWLGGTDWNPLGSVAGAVPCGFDLSSSWSVDGTGNTAVGLVWLADVCKAHAGSWDLVAGGPATDLGSHSATSASRANTISGNGRVIGGWQDSPLGARLGARWSDGSMRLVKTDSGQSVGEVLQMNYDGTAMAGLSDPYGSDDGWVWTRGQGFRAISTGTEFPIAIPTSIDDDGSIVGGVSREFVTGASRGWVFAGGELIWIDEYAAAHGMASGWTLLSVTALSADGHTLAGFGLNPDGLLEGFVIGDFSVR